MGYGYDGQGNRTELTYPDGKIANYAYDGLDRLGWVKDWDNRETVYQYDAAGRMEQVTLPNGVTSLYDYDATGRLETITHRRGEMLLAEYQYAYDLSGNRLQAVENVRQLVQDSGTPPGWTPPTEFSVEEQGYQAAVLSWPTLGTGGYMLERSTDGVNWQAVATLDADTQRYIDEGLARHTQYWYRLIPDDGQGTPVEITAETGSEPVTYVEAGSGEWTEGELVEMVIDYQYDDLYRVIEANYSDGTFYYYAYDANGNRVSETTAAGEILSTYDIANRLTSVGGVAYTWDRNGNLTGDGVNTYVYDRANRLSSATTGGETTSYAYNGLNDRLVEGGTQFVMDLNTGLTQVVQDETNSYLYGNGRIGQFAGVESAYFLGDALGSVRQLVDGSGLVSLVKSYEPYGKTAGSIGISDTKYSFTGEWQSTAEMLYLRARFYSNNGYFITKDSWQGNNTKPMSYNSWLYAYSNPLIFIDPSGNCPVGQDCSRVEHLCYLLPDPVARELCLKSTRCRFPDAPKLPEMPKGLGPKGREAFETYLKLWERGGWWNNHQPYTLTREKYLEHLFIFELDAAKTSIKELNWSILTDTAVGNFFYTCDEKFPGSPNCTKTTDYNVFYYIGLRRLLSNYEGKNYSIKSEEDYNKWKPRLLKLDIESALISPWERRYWKLGNISMEWGNKSSPHIKYKTQLDSARKGRMINQYVEKVEGPDPFFIFTYCQIGLFGDGKVPIDSFYCNRPENWDLDGPQRKDFLK